MCRWRFLIVFKLYPALCSLTGFEMAVIGDHSIYDANNYTPVAVKVVIPLI